MIEVRQLTMTSEDRPTQWEGLVGDRGSIYIRYRSGALEVYVSDTSPDPLNDGVRIFDKRIVGRYEGQMTTDQMKSALTEVCHFSG